MFFPSKAFPSRNLIWFTVVIVSLLQYPISILVHEHSFLWGILLNELGVVLLFPLLISAWKKFDFRVLFPFKKPKIQLLLLTLLFTFSADILMEYLTSLTDFFLPAENLAKQAMENVLTIDSRADFILKLLVLSFLPGFCEEILVRGYCQVSLQARYGLRYGILIAAFIFALLHQNPWYFHLYFLLGAMFSFLMGGSKNLVYPILAHILNNAFTLSFHARQIAFPVIAFNSSEDIFIILLAALLLLVSGRMFWKLSHSS